MSRATPPITHKILRDWAGEQVFRDAETIFKKGLVEKVTYEHPIIEGSIRWANRSIRTKLRILDEGAAENRCPCRDNTERGIVCAHVIALGLSLVARHTDPMRDAKYLEEQRRAERLAEFDDSDYIQRTQKAVVGGVPAKLRLTLEEDWRDAARQGSLPVRCEADFHSYRSGLADLPRNQIFQFSKQDDAILYVLEDISEGPARNTLNVGSSDFINLLGLTRGGDFWDSSEDPVHVNDIRVTSRLHMDLDRENGELILFIHTELPVEKPGEFPIYISNGKKGWAYLAGHFWELESLLPLPLHAIYDEPVVIAREAVPRFLRHELPALEAHMPVATDITLDLFTMDPGTPVFRLRERGSPASLAPTLYAEYPGVSLIAGKEEAAGSFAIPDPDDLLRYTVRNRHAERAGLDVLADYGILGERGDDLTPIVGTREVLNHLGGQLPALRRRGWKIDLEGKVGPFMDDLEFMTPVVHVQTEQGANWFDVDFDFECGSDQSLSETDIQRAMLRGDSYVDHGGKPVLFDTAAISELRDVFSDIWGQQSDAQARMRVDHIHSAYVKASLDALDGVDVEADAAWRNSASRQNRNTEVEPVELQENLEATLRPYQKDGVNWLRFLEHHGFAGILADEMGLGKTIQTLAWLSLKRCNNALQSTPTLIVCPTSLVENWADEAARFVPELDVLIMSGTERNKKWEEIRAADLVITSYALMRRDVDQYLETEFAAVVLDEAQHIKNKSTQNAVSAKQLRAHHKLVLTGTPVENSVSDLWSIMDFLMPGYLGRHDSFREVYELPISRGESDGEFAQNKLRRKLHPFMMRRLKTNVAKDLPPKVSKIMSCTLTTDQKLVYKQYLDSSRRKLTDMVASKGFAQCRMEVLKVLLRLRQVCCHLDLLKLEDLESKHPSAKLDVFFELLDEAIDGGHRILVFSQFTSMLHILQREIEAKGLSYCYLDGSTKDRMSIVRKFNTDRSIPLFLISLKAGGTGLNLTGADMVIHFDPWWNPAVEDQATDRAHRIGQKRMVYNIKLITKDTVEEKVLALQEKKRSVIDATVEASGDAAKDLSWDDVQELLTL